MLQQTLLSKLDRDRDADDDTLRMREHERSKFLALLAKLQDMEKLVSEQVCVCTRVYVCVHVCIYSKLWISEVSAFASIG